MIAVADAIDLDALRLRHEFLEMPGLQLSVAQAARLVGISTTRAKTLLAALEKEGFLTSSVGATVWRRNEFRSVKE